MTSVESKNQMSKYFKIAALCAGLLLSQKARSYTKELVADIPPVNSTVVDTRDTIVPLMQYRIGERSLSVEPNGYYARTIVDSMGVKHLLCYEDEQGSFVKVDRVKQGFESNILPYIDSINYDSLVDRYISQIIEQPVPENMASEVRSVAAALHNKEGMRHIFKIFESSRKLKLDIILSSQYFSKLITEFNGDRELALEELLHRIDKIKKSYIEPNGRFDSSLAMAKTRASGKIELYMNKICNSEGVLDVDSLLLNSILMHELQHLFRLTPYARDVYAGLLNPNIANPYMRELTEMDGYRRNFESLLMELGWKSTDAFGWELYNQVVTKFNTEHPTNHIPYLFLMQVKGFQLNESEKGVFIVPSHDHYENIVKIFTLITCNDDAADYSHDV